jgi:hypothetical protein
MKSLALSAFLVSSLSADYKLVLTDKDGVQTSECIKSYSFSNNLESIAKQKGIGQDIYAEEETLTNKIYFGKPVYRKVSKSVFSLEYTRIALSDVEDLVSSHLTVKQFNHQHSFVGNHNWKTTSALASSYYDGDLKAFSFKTFHNEWIGLPVQIIIEYTKTKDLANTASSEFKSYLHYIPSSSQTQELVSKDMDELGVQLLKNYSYDSSTQSCNKL